MIEWVKILFARIINFVFLGSKSILSSKNKPYVCGVYDFSTPEDGHIKGRLFYPSKRSTLISSPGAKWSTHSVANIVYGKLVYWLRPNSRSEIVQYLCLVVYYLCRMIPCSFLPRLPDSVQATESPEISSQEPNLPLIVWSHGRGGNVHDHALLLSQLAVEVPAICVAITHTDGSADTWPSALKRRPACYYHHSQASGQEDRYLSELVEMSEYQIRYRIRELEDTIQLVKSLVKFERVVVGGFDLGGATALAAAARLNAECVITVDGMFALEDRFKFPRLLFPHEFQIPCPVAFIVSDEVHLWDKAVTDNTMELVNKSSSNKYIPVKQSKHNNFIEPVIYWIPQISLIALRMSGLIHRRGCPRKTYRRSAKWLVALIQQFSTTTTS